MVGYGEHKVGSLLAKPNSYQLVVSATPAGCSLAPILVNTPHLGFDFARCATWTNVPTLLTMSVGSGNGRVLLNLLASRGDQNGVAHAIDQHADMVYATCRRILGNDAELPMSHRRPSFIS